MDICVTSLRPDIVIFNEQKKTMDIFELTCPLEPNIKQIHSEKENLVYNICWSTPIEPKPKIQKRWKTTSLEEDLN